MIAHLQPAELDCYRRHLAHARSVLEYGVGGSTVLAAENGVERLYCVESDLNWLRNVAAQPAVAALVSAGRARLVHVDIGPVGKWGYPKDKSRRSEWPSYSMKPWQDGFSPDLVFIDGRFRVSCALQALLHGPPDTLIAIDDFWRGKRKAYRVILAVASIVESAGHMVVLKRRRTYSRSLAKILARWYAYNPA